MATIGASTKRKSPSTSDYVAADNQSAFATDAIHLKDTIARYGVATILNVLNPQEAKDMRDGMLTFLETITRNFDTHIDRNRKATWRSFYDLDPLHDMLLQHWVCLELASERVHHQHIQRVVGHRRFVGELRWKFVCVSSRSNETWILSKQGKVPPRPTPERSILSVCSELGKCVGRSSWRRYSDRVGRQ